jgi:hypothetical protein
LIDIGPAGERVEPKLLLTLNIADPISYTSLSHRWGSAKMFQLTSKNLECLQLEIPLQELSKVFQDAFVACKKLGMRYIWIDSLCIIQDDSQDWEKEAARMKDVYSHAKFNISATGAMTGDHGLFFDREAIALEPFVFDLSQSERSTTWKAGSYRLLDPSMWSSNVSRAALNQRGWVLQERVLARRILHFCGDQLFFECHELDACEMFAKGLPTSRIFHNRDLGASSNGHFKRLDPELDGGWLRDIKSMSRLKSDPALNIFSIWGELVETYSSFTLTKWEDKLVAFSGIAKLMVEILNDEYLAGLWRGHLPYHMLWSRRKDGGLGTEPMTYIAPSWSWASVQAPVTLHPITDGRNEDILIDILNAETYTQDSDVTGSVFGGFIKLKGYLRQAECAVWFNDQSSLRTERNETCLAMTPGGPRVDIMVWPDETDQFGPEGSMRTDVFCLPIQIWRNDKGDFCTEGLILEKLDFDQDAFKRMGKFKIAIGSKRGWSAFYGTSNCDWKTGSAGKTLSSLAAFKERVITIV